MTHFRSGVRDRLASREVHDFGDLLYRQVRNAPWVGLSILVHGGVLGLLLLFPPAEEAVEQSPRVLEMVAAEAAPVLDEPEEPPDVQQQDPVEQTQKFEQDPVLEPVDQITEVDVDADDDEPLDAFDQGISFLTGPGTNPTIGIGGNSGGPLGEGRGGNKNLRGVGDSRRTETAVDLALEWLKKHQSQGGKWEAEHFSTHCKLNKCDGPGEAVYDPGVTGLALLAFLGHGETHQAGPYRDVVKKGLKYLKNVQDSEGCVGPQTSPHFMYNHACAALALVEAYGMTGSRQLRGAAQRSVNFVHKAQNPYLAWRYGVRDGDNDTSVTGWMTMVLKSAQMSELDVDKGAFRGAIAWIDKVTEPEFGRVGYQNRGGQSSRTHDMLERFPAEQTEALTAVALTARIFAGEDPASSDPIRKGAGLLARKPPRWDDEAGTNDMYYWYYGTLAMFQVGGEPWRKWEAGMKTSILENQRTERGRDERGSWDPVGPWAPEGGRVYSTSLMAMCLEVYYRYTRLSLAR
jgi:hypothetical protein